MGHVELNKVSYVLPDGRVLLDECRLPGRRGRQGRARRGQRRGQDHPAAHHQRRPRSAQRSGRCSAAAWRDAAVRRLACGTTARCVTCCCPSPRPRVRAAAAAVDAAELAMMERDDERDAAALRAGAGRLGRRRRLRRRGALGRLPHRGARDAVRPRRSGARSRTLSGGEQKRLVLEALLRGPDEVLLLDEPDNYLDVPGKRWLEEQLRETPKTVLFVSHDRELLAQTADRVVTVELARRATRWVHGGGFALLSRGPAGPARAAGRAAPPLGRGARQAQGAGAARCRSKAAYNDAMASRYQAAVTRLSEFEEAGPPQAQPPRAERADAAARRAYRQARGRSARGWS